MGFQEADKYQVVIVTDLCYGDSGKGNLVDYLVRRGNINMVARVSGGPNTGATVHKDGKDAVLHLIPVGILTPKIKNVMTGQEFFDPYVFQEDLRTAEEFRGKISDEELYVDFNLPVIFPYHRALDLVLNQELGTTGRGVGLAAADFVQRKSIAINDLFDSDLEAKIYDNLEDNDVVRKVAIAMRNGENKSTLGKIVETTDNFNPRVMAEDYMVLAEVVRPYIFNINAGSYDSNERILIEGTQGIMLDVLHGGRPYVSSSPVSPYGLLNCLGLAVDSGDFYSLALIKALPSKVGAGPLPTKIHGEEETRLRNKGSEYGATTGRPRDIYYHVIPALQHALRQVPRPRGLVISKADTVADETLRVYRDYRFRGQDIINYSRYHRQDGDTLNYYPRNVKVLERLEGSNPKFFGPLEDATKFESLRELNKTELGDYVNYIADSCGINLIAVGNGKGRYIE